MEFTEIMKLARNLMDKHGLRYASLREIRTRKALGQCHQNLIFTELRFSSISLPLCSDEEIINTILHEIAHGIVGVHHGHDNVWRRKHIELGGNGERTHMITKNQEESFGNIYKYIGECPNGHQHRSQRLPKRQISCGFCSRRFDTRFLITYKPNPNYGKTVAEPKIKIEILKGKRVSV